MNGLHRKAAKAHFLAGTDLMELCTGGKTVLLQLVFDQANGQTCSVNGHVELFEQIRQAADMVFVAMRQEHTAYSVLVFDKIGHIGNDQINAIHLIVREAETAVNDDDILPIFQNGHILTDLIQTAQGDDF